MHGTGALYSARFVIANVLTCAPSVAAITISKLINALIDNESARNVNISSDAHIINAYA